MMAHVMKRDALHHLIEHAAYPKKTDKRTQKEGSGHTGKRKAVKLMKVFEIDF